VKSATEFNQRCIADLKGVGLSDYVVVVGAGPSSPYIAPVSDLIRSLASACCVIQEDGEELWDFCEKACGANPIEYFRVIRKSFGEAPYWDSRIYKYLISAPFRNFLTLNYDCQLPEAFAERFDQDHDDRFRVYPPRPGDSYFSPIEFVSGGHQLMALHGFANPKDPAWEKRVILRLEDYNQHYTGTNPRLFEWWQTVLATTPCIFVGTSLREPGLARVFKHSSGTLLDAIGSKGHIHLLPCPPEGDPPVYREPSESFPGVRQLFFDPLDKRYSGLVQILEAFSSYRRITPNPRTKSVPALSATEPLGLPDVPRS
jgi:hypothetical protein